ncbi:ComEA family DNA-binding protein [Shewanella sp. JM162201]|uniref:ComEA family DNA-binding protein n=1 Tax=Shewanella jiangmenensis TaxID=2837387 RepID=A0ABS5UZW1_9GAMM|nr:ComEA family DNA-binding protein [Shewanella jiangmenensis]MBT1443183.1 ComEA family DNA-binding protein [Shewanella jiangmenensis]
MNKILVTLLVAAATQFSAVAADASKSADVSKAATSAEQKAEKTADAAVAQSSKININTASEAELKLLKGVGDAKAKAIVEYRKQYGQFATVEDLTKVSGIGSKVLEDNRHLLTL